MFTSGEKHNFFKINNKNTMKTIKKSIEINAPKEKVWEVLTEDRYTRIWYAEFHEGSHAVTDWKQGSKAQFIDNDGSGIVGVIAVSESGKELVIEYTGMVMKGVEDFESDMAKEFKGARESYKLSEKDGVTIIDLAGDMNDQMYEMMSGLWEKAFAKLKELAEEN